MAYGGLSFHDDRHPSLSINTDHGAISAMYAVPVAIWWALYGTLWGGFCAGVQRAGFIPLITPAKPKPPF